MNTAELSKICRQVRRDIINMTANAGSGHPGGSLSAVELMTSVFHNHMRLDPKNPKWEDRDRFVLSKGHSAPCYYAVLASLGFIDRSEYANFRQLHSILQGHPDCKKVPGVDASTGSLGQGCSIAVGMALGAKKLGKDTQVFTLLGDGECQEGQIWEAVLFAAQQRLDNLVVFVDQNLEQLDGPVARVNNLESFAEKFSAFHWNVLEVDGHDYAQLHDAIQAAKVRNGAPTAIIMHTVKGKGCTFAEGKFNHHINVSQEQAEEAIAALEALKEGR